MKKILAFALLGMTVLGVQAQERPKPASPPATVTQKINSGATVTISYSQPFTERKSYREGCGTHDG